MSKSSKVKHPGTFKGISEKINYLKKTGINAVLLMPSYEFEEYAFNFNYWGYGKGFYFLPKAAYSSCYGSCVDYTVEFKDMVKNFIRTVWKSIWNLILPMKLTPVWQMTV